MNVQACLKYSLTAKVKSWQLVVNHRLPLAEVLTFVPKCILLSGLVEATFRTYLLD
jgi:hypothetical protein